MPRGANAAKLWPALPLKWSVMVSSGSPSAPYFRVISLPDDRADHAVDIADRDVREDLLTALEGRSTDLQQSRQSSDFSRPWSCSWEQKRPTSGGASGA